MAEIDIYLPTLHSFAMNNIFTGSCGALRFRIVPNVVKKTQKEVADLMGISQSYISRLEKKNMKRLRKEIVRYE